jgi:hypothetical protein
MDGLEGTAFVCELRVPIYAIYFGEVIYCTALSDCDNPLKASWPDGLGDKFLTQIYWENVK